MRLGYHSSSNAIRPAQRSGRSIRLLLHMLGAIALSGSLHAQLTWTPAGPTGTIFSVAGDGEGLMLGAAQSGILRSTDNGRTWNPTGMTSPAHSVSIGPNGLAFATYSGAGGSGDALTRSTDGGATWTPLQRASRAVRGVTFDNEGMPVALLRDSLLRSIDDGLEWEPYGREGFGSSFYDLMKLAIGPNGEMMLGNWGITGGLVYLSLDGGAFWQQVYNAGSDMLVLEYSSSGSAFLATRDRFVRSSDGEIWTPVAGISTPPSQMHVSGEEIVIASDAIYRSTDDGDTWTRIADLPPLPANGRLNDLARAGNGDLVAATTHGIYRLSTTSSVKSVEQRGAGLALHPNPPRGAATIELPSAVRHGCRIELVDMTGRSVLTIDNVVPGTRTIGVASDDLADGIYLLRVDLDGVRLTRKVVVAR